MLDVRVVVRQFSARHWSRVPFEYEEFEPGDHVVAMRHESGQTIFARESDPVGRYIIEIDEFRLYTRSVDSQQTRRAGGS
jgi:hypothetical protein